MTIMNVPSSWRKTEPFDGIKNLMPTGVTVEAFYDGRSAEDRQTLYCFIDTTVDPIRHVAVRLDDIYKDHEIMKPSELKERIVDPVIDALLSRRAA